MKCTNCGYDPDPERLDRLPPPTRERVGCIVRVGESRFVCLMNAYDQQARWLEIEPDRPFTLVKRADVELPL